MKKHILLLFTIFSAITFAQGNFEKGYFITNSNDTITCFIKNIDWRNNPTEFDYYINSTSNIETNSIANVKEFSLGTMLKYVRDTVLIDRSSFQVDKLSKTRAPDLNKEVLFLKVIVEGKANLYSYTDMPIIRYFYSSDSKTSIEPLIYKEYQMENLDIGVNNQFIQQLSFNLKCSGIKQSEYENLKYKKGDLEELFIKYNTCDSKVASTSKQKTSKVYKRKSTTDWFDLALTLGASNQTFSISATDNQFEETEFDSEIGIKIGLEAEIKFPYNNGRWSFIVSPNYSAYSTIGEVYRSETVNAQFDLDYKILEIPVGIRHYFMRDSEKFRVYANVFYAIIVDMGSEVILEYATTNPPEVRSNGDFLGGLGVAYNNAFSAELRGSIGRQVLGEYRNYDTNYQYVALILGYKFL